MRRICILCLVVFAYNFIFIPTSYGVKPLKVTYLSIPGTAFVGNPSLTLPTGTSDTIAYLAPGDVTADPSTEREWAVCYAPVQLPHGAKIGAVKAIVRDETDAGNIEIRLYRAISDEVPNYQLFAEADTGYEDTNYIELGEMQLDILCPDCTLVNNNEWFYSLEVQIIGDTTPADSRPLLLLRGVIIEYQPAK